MSTKKTKTKQGRPPVPVPVNHWRGIVECVAVGDSLESYCRKHKINSRTVRLWLAKDPEFRTEYHLARELACDHLVGEALKLTEEMDDSTVQSRRLRVDTIKWWAAKHGKAIYGDHQKVEHEGNVNITVVTGVPQTDAETVRLVDNPTIKTSE